MPIRTCVRFVALALAIAPGVMAQAPILLTHSWTVGAPRSYSMELDVSLTQSVVGTDQVMRSEQRVRWAFDLEPFGIEDSGQVQLELRTTSLRMEMETSNAPDPVVFDSADGPYAATVGQALRENPLSIRIHPTGEVLGVAGGDALRSAIIEESSDDGPNIAIGRFLLAFFRDADIARTYEHMFGILPNVPTNIGDTWQNTDSRESPGAGTMEFENTWRLDSAAGDPVPTLAVVRASADVSLIPAAGAPEGLVFELQSGLQNSRLTYDISGGLISKSLTESTTLMQITQEAAGRTMQIEASTELSMALVSDSQSR